MPIFNGDADAWISWSACSPLPFGTGGTVLSFLPGTGWASNRYITITTKAFFSLDRNSNAWLPLMNSKKRSIPRPFPFICTYQYIPAPRTIFRHTHKLLPGHFLTLDQNGLHQRTYWKIQPEKEPAAFPGWSEKDHVAHLDRLLTRAVADRLVSDVPLGALLSGGIDSSVVVALMQKTSPTKIKTFSIGVRDRDYNEAPWAAKVAAHLGTDHTELEVTPNDALSLIPRLAEIYDEPYADSSAIPTTLVSLLTRSRVTVALSGDGGDEQFAGYIRYWSTAAMEKTFHRLPSALKRFFCRCLKMGPAPWCRGLLSSVATDSAPTFQRGQFYRTSGKSSYI